MDKKQLGKRIKEIRLSKKMTQSEVVGSFITRNMLSQIESGSASPSMKTLNYLAEVLDVPIDQLITQSDFDTGESASTDEVRQLLSAKDAYKKGNFVQSIELAEPLCDSVFDDEAYSIMAHSFLQLSQAHLQNGELEQALVTAEKAVGLCDKGIFASREVKTAALISIDRITDTLLDNSPSQKR